MKLTFPIKFGVPNHSVKHSSSEIFLSSFLIQFNQRQMWDVKLIWWTDTFSQHQINFRSFDWSMATRKAWLPFNISWYTLRFSRLPNCNPPLWLYTITPEAWFIKSLRLILTPISIRLLHDTISVYMWFIVPLKMIKGKYHNDVFLRYFQIKLY